MTSAAEGMKQVVIHTDGGCLGNPGPGAWAVVLRCGKHMKELSGGVPATTNNRMELQAAIEGLRALKEPCEVQFFTDSQYVRNGITKWVAGWKRSGWKTATKQPVKNEELWRALDEATKPHRIQWQWLKGHAGHKDNERCDELARIAMDKMRSQRNGASTNPVAPRASAESTVKREPTGCFEFGM